jgi:hypothetical protein
MHGLDWAPQPWRRGKHRHDLCDLPQLLHPNGEQHRHHRPRHRRNEAVTLGATAVDNDLRCPEASSTRDSPKRPTTGMGSVTVNPMTMWNAIDALLCAAVTARTTRRPSVLARSKNVS